MSLPEVLKNLDAWKELKKAGVTAVGINTSKEAEAKAKQEAPWQDRTGNARQGLRGTSGWEGEILKIRLSHSMEYGPYLELCNDGKYAILEKTLNSFREELHNNLKRIMEK